MTPSLTTPAPAEKQQALVDAISAGTKGKLDSSFTAVLNELAKLNVSVNGLAARLDLLENSTTTSTGGAAKRSVRTTPATAATKTATGAKKGGATASIGNSLLFFRHQLAEDEGDLRTKWGTPENIEAIKGDALFSKKDEVKNPAEYWSAAGFALWKMVLTTEDKEAVKGEFERWKNDKTSKDAAPALEQDIAHG